MLVMYDGVHSINFFSDLKYYGGRLDGVFNTWTNWHLIPKVKPYVSTATPNFKLMQLPVSNAVMDLTDYYAGGMHYGMRSGEWEFLVDINQWSSSNEAFSYFLANIHGKKLYCELTDHPGTVYYGCFSIISYESSENFPSMKISYQIFPEVYLAGDYEYDSQSNDYYIHYDENADIDDRSTPIELGPFVDPDSQVDSDLIEVINGRLVIPYGIQGYTINGTTFASDSDVTGNTISGTTLVITNNNE